ncbi:hypothetical protein [Salipiger marinus]|uniref:hypothetical protein n=1 Tax=Salipiger marinus TaxID=555512 RepID=UPI004058A872
MSKDEPPLGPAASDHVAAFLRMGTGFVPFVGTALAELITQVVPGQRIQRLETYCRYLSRELSLLQEDELRERLSNPERVDLFEEGAYQSARALSVDRQEKIAKAVAFGISGDDQEILETKRVLSLLRQLDDAEIVILTSRLDRFSRDDDFQTKHEDVIYAPGLHMQSSREEMDKNTVFKIAMNKLEQLGLIEPVYKKPKKGEAPDMDPATGRLKATYQRVSMSGRLLLRRIGVAEEDDF